MAERMGTPGIAIAGFVLALIGALFSFTLLFAFAVPVGVAGGVLSTIGLRQARESGARRGVAIAGMVLGAVALVIGIWVGVLVITSEEISFEL